MRVFDSGVMVVQLQSHSEEEMIASALDNVSAVPSYSPICEITYVAIQTSCSNFV